MVQFTLKGETDGNSIMGLTDGSGIIFLLKNSKYSLNFLCRLLKFMLEKCGNMTSVLQFCAQQSVTSWRRLECVAKVSTMSQVILFLLFTSKEWAKMATPQPAQIGTKKYFFCINIEMATTWSMQKRIFAHFLHFHANFHAPFSPLWASTSCFQTVPAVSSINQLFLNWSCCHQF